MTHITPGLPAAPGRCGRILVREGRLELPRTEAPDPKSGASTNSATLARWVLQRQRHRPGRPAFARRPPALTVAMTARVKESHLPASAAKGKTPPGRFGYRLVRMYSLNLRVCSRVSISSSERVLDMFGSVSLRNSMRSQGSTMSPRDLLSGYTVDDARDH